MKIVVKHGHCTKLDFCCGLAKEYYDNYFNYIRVDFSEERCYLQIDGSAYWPVCPHCGASVIGMVIHDGNFSGSMQMMSKPNLG